MKIMELPQNERPQERLFRYGVEPLSNSELIALILRTGNSSESAIGLSSRIIAECGGLDGLLNSSAVELMKIKGIKTAKAAQILALAELAKRFKSYKSGDEFKVTSPESVAQYVMMDMMSLKQEILRVIMLNTKNMIISMKDISIGSVNSSIVHPREVFCEAIKKHSTSVIVCHNHPSGDPSPSVEDINITKRLVECGKILGVELLDHIIIGNRKYVSLKEELLL